MFKLIVLLIGLFFIVSFVMGSIREIALMAMKRSSAIRQKEPAMPATHEQVMNELHALRKELEALRAEKNNIKAIEDRR